MSGHDHHHEHHTHAAGCSCGHDSEHNHTSGEKCNCGAQDCDAPGFVHTEYHLHGDAHVISGRLTIVACYDTLRAALSLKLEHIAKAIQEMGGIVGHIKAACTVTRVEMFSVTDVDITVKEAPEQEIKINLAAIVFLIKPEEAASLVTQALEAIRDGTGI